MDSGGPPPPPPRKPRPSQSLRTVPAEAHGFDSEGNGYIPEKDAKGHQILDQNL